MNLKQYRRVSKTELGRYKKEKGDKNGNFPICPLECG